MTDLIFTFHTRKNGPDPFRTTVFVPMEFENIFRPKLNEVVTWIVGLSV